jgi:hypothetical protein
MSQPLAVCLRFEDELQTGPLSPRVRNARLELNGEALVVYRDGPERTWRNHLEKL